MSLMAQAVPTAADAGFIGTFPQSYGHSARSTINTLVIDAQIREVLAEWDDLDLDEILPIAPPDRPQGYPSDAVAAVEYLRDELQVSQDFVLSSTGIAERTFFGWKQQGRRPRVSSTGRLWSAVEAIYYLSQSHPNLAGWFQDEGTAMQRFADGDFDGLVQLELDWAIRTYKAAAPQAVVDDADDRVRLAKDSSEELVTGRRGLRRIQPVTPTKLKARPSN